jgi:chaperonin GroES
MTSAAIKKHLVDEDLWSIAEMDTDVERLTPLRGRLLGKLNKEDAVTPGGIELPEAARRTKHEVTIVSLGESDPEDPWPEAFKKGVVLITRPYGGQEIKIGKDNYLFLKMEDIVAINESV